MLALAGVREASALLLQISVTWTAEEANAQHLQDGSIVQVVLRQSAGQTPSNSNPGDNFLVYGTTEDTAGLVPQPEPPAPPVPATVYLPNTTQDGNIIVYTGTVTRKPDDGPATFQQWIYISQAEAAQYDTVYLRVFSATTFPEGEDPEPSWWGISQEKDLEFDGAGMGFSYFSSVTLPNRDYFEVIPEPGTLGLLCGGAWGVGLWGWVGRRRRKDAARNGETGVQAR